MIVHLQLAVAKIASPANLSIGITSAICKSDASNDLRALCSRCRLCFNGSFWNMLGRQQSTLSEMPSVAFTTVHREYTPNQLINLTKLQSMVLSLNTSAELEHITHHKWLHCSKIIETAIGESDELPSVSNHGYDFAQRNPVPDRFYKTWMNLEFSQAACVDFSARNTFFFFFKTSFLAPRRYIPISWHRLPPVQWLRGQWKTQEGNKKQTHNKHKKNGHWVIPVVQSWPWPSTKHRIDLDNFRPACQSVWSRESCWNETLKHHGI